MTLLGMSSLSQRLDPRNIYQLHFKVYGGTGYWRVLSPSKRKQLIYDAYFFLVHLGFNTLTIGLLIDAYVIRKDIEKLSTNLCSSITCVGTFFKVWIFNINRGKIERICEKLENSLYLPQIGKSKRDKDIAQKYAKTVAKVSRILWGMDIFLVIFWSTFPVLDTGNTIGYPFPFPVYHAQTPLYEFIYGYQVLVLISIAFNVLTYDMIFYGMVARVCVQYEIVAKNISEIKKMYTQDYFKKWESYEEMDKGRNQEVVKKIKENVVHHLAILKQIKEVEDLFSIPILIQIICGAALIGVIAYGIIMKSQGFTLEQMQRVFYVGCAMFDVGLYCYFGTQLEIKSNLVKEALYDNPWYEMKIEIRKLYMIMISNLQRKVRIRGGGIFQVTLKTYLELLKISYNLTAVLRQARSRD